MNIEEEKTRKEIGGNITLDPLFPINFKDRAKGFENQQFHNFNLNQINDQEIIEEVMNLNLNENINKEKEKLDQCQNEDLFNNRPVYDENNTHKLNAYRGPSDSMMENEIESEDRVCTKKDNVAEILDRKAFKKFTNKPLEDENKEIGNSQNILNSINKFNFENNMDDFNDPFKLSKEKPKNLKKDSKINKVSKRTIIYRILI